ncbi:hypothetical protein GBAR_LOCUS13457, partial [Geodia barretti]
MMQVEVCKVIPSCFEAEINEGPVSVLANGSSFLFFIIFEKVVSVKFYDTAAVLHVSPLLCSGSQQPLALCCLSNGNISALSLKLAISRVPTEVQSADILSSLFGETCDNISAPAQAVDGRDVSVSLFLSPVRQWSIRSAFVCNDKLIVSARKEHCSVLNVYLSSSVILFGEHKLPVFSSSVLFQHEIGSCSVPSKGLLSTTIAYRPVLSLLRSQSSVKSDSSTLSIASSASDVFFRQLFGFELSLARSIV